MRKYPSTIRSTATLIMTLAATLCFAACKDGNPVAPPLDYKITQSDLDKSSAVIDTAIVGDRFMVFHRIKDTTTYLHGARDVSGNLLAKNSPLDVGTIFVRKYASIPDSTHAWPRTTEKVMLMVKRFGGYFPDGGDWEYILTRYDASVDKSIHPNGLLPTEPTNTNIDSSMTGMRGKLYTRCAQCHEARRDQSFLFPNQH
jgi:hypothetical protein